ncbi:PREDICTED: protein S100-A13 isoform X4 [Chinchilla lanigera]|uniref:protein S100-A13 isoform X4 n=1 Tax=Chinchilla lanigera TaxID=34839 RepID=UPI000696BBA6|nr:PREDICTED: protein S100-A13 isoform X4 [Chinchilla lanigera]
MPLGAASGPIKPSVGSGARAVPCPEPVIQGQECVEDGGVLCISPVQLTSRMRGAEMMGLARLTTAGPLPAPTSLPGTVASVWAGARFLCQQALEKNNLLTLCGCEEQQAGALGTGTPLGRRQTAGSRAGPPHRGLVRGATSEGPEKGPLD